jgi:uncharacterized protein YyaL (SSP411 family)
MARNTLQRIARGAIHDHIGGGFKRYAVDRKWREPHFEKMLYDNALLAMAFAEAYRLTAQASFAQAAQQTFAWAFRDMVLPEGAFASAMHADNSEGDASFYFWSPDEVANLLGEDKGETLCNYLNITTPDAMPFAAQRAKPPAGLAEMLEALRTYRAQRSAPPRDDQVLTAWNAWMILALCRAGEILGEPARHDYNAYAIRAARFVQTRLAHPDGTLATAWANDTAAGDGTLTDYAAWALALCGLYDATWDGAWLDLAVLTAQRMVERFGGEEAGFTLAPSTGKTADGTPHPLTLLSTADDGTPGPNAVALLALARLVHLGADTLKPWLEKTEGFVASAVRGQPDGHAFAGLALLETLRPRPTLLCLHPTANTADDLRAALQGRPPVDVLLQDESTPAFARARLDAQAQGVQGPAYVLCKEGRCGLPTPSIDDIKAQL